MITDELIATIKEQFQKGKRRSEIKEDLLTQGFKEEDVDAAIAKIQHDAIKQLPGIAWVYRRIEQFESRANITSPRMTIVLMIACIGLLVVLAGGLYVTFDPLGTQATARDSRRQADVTELQNALFVYYQKYTMYPATLNKLVPEFLATIPKDPQSGKQYSYQPLDNGNSYKICISYELQHPQCLSAQQTKSVIPIIPTDTPVPSFVPKTISGAPNYHAQ